MTQRTPVFFDPALNVHRPMDPSDNIPPTFIPISNLGGNQLQYMSDGLYAGNESGIVIYVDSVGGADTNPGTRASPFRTIDSALANLASRFPAGVFKGYNVVLALKANQSYPMTADFMIPTDSQLIVSFYGDPKYGDFNTVGVAAPANAWNLQDLQRPTILPAVSQTQGLWKLAGFNLAGGEVSLRGLTINLPAAPSNPGIGVYSSLSDFVRSIPASAISTVGLHGTVFNMTDRGSYWGALGCESRSQLSVSQFASRFLIEGQALTSGTKWDTTLLNARQYLIKLYSDYAGNNQQVSYLSPTAATSSGGSGMIFMSWTDTEALPVAGTNSVQSFPFSFEAGFGLIQYVYGLNRGPGANGQLLNLISARLI